MAERSVAPAYTGAYQDPVTGGYPLGHGYRHYLPALMRFNAPDDWSPFGAGGINAYAYCAGDPINRVDPSGHFPWLFAVITVLPLMPLNLIPGVGEVADVVAATELAGEVAEEGTDLAIGAAKGVSAAAGAADEAGASSESSAEGTVARRLSGGRHTGASEHPRDFFKSFDHYDEGARPRARQFPDVARNRQFAQGIQRDLRKVSNQLDRVSNTFDAIQSHLDTAPLNEIDTEDLELGSNALSLRAIGAQFIDANEDRTVDRIYIGSRRAALLMAKDPSADDLGRLWMHVSWERETLVERMNQLYRRLGALNDRMETIEALQWRVVNGYDI